MISAALHPDEALRLQCLRTLQILDTPPEPAFDAITRLLAAQLPCPIVLLTLVDADRQWFKSRQGLGATETGRDEAFCAHAILGSEQLVVADALLDERFADNPLVRGETGIRFYAGQPLRVDGQPVGTLCAIDHQPRRWSAAQAQLLSQMALVAEGLLTAALAQRRGAVREARLEDFVRASSGCRWECDAQLRFTWLSPEAAEVGGAQARPGQPLWDGQPLDALGQPAAQPGLHALLRAGPDRAEARVRLAGAEPTRVLQVAALPVDGPAGERLGWRGTASDVTPLVAAQQVLREADAAARRREEQMQFLARLSHELRTPMNAVLGFMQLLREDPSATPMPHHRRWLDLMSQGGQHLLALIDDVLSLTQPRQPGRELALQALSARTVAADCIALLSPLALQAGVVLASRDAGTDATVRADGRALMQVLLNVLGNAIKYSPRGGQVSLSLGADDGHCTIAVQDEGPGIPAPQLARLFLPFERLGAEAGSVQGTGLGLSIAKALMDAMGGGIDAASPPGTGCCIRITLPQA